MTVAIGSRAAASLSPGDSQGQIPNLDAWDKDRGASDITWALMITPVAFSSVSVAATFVESHPLL